ncbi:MAG: hypothetical protein ACYC4Q_09610 [Victivallaceae bacterium]
MIRPVKNLSRKLFANYYLLLKKTHIAVLILLLSAPVLLTGIFTSPRFNDGVWHLKLVRAWCEEGGRPLKLTSKNNFGIFPEESPLWYFITSKLCSATGGYDYRTVQVFQAVLTGILLWLVFILAQMLCGSFRAKTAVLLTGITPILPVCAILCYIDLLCGCLILLTIILLYKKQFLWTAVTAAGMWYAKRTGMLLIPLYFLILTYLCAMQYKKRIVRAVLTVAGCLLIFLALICWDVEFRGKHFGSDDMIINNLAKIAAAAGINVQLKAPPPLPAEWFEIKFNSNPIDGLQLVANNRPAADIPLPNFLQWFGFGIPLLLLLALAQLAGPRKYLLAFLRKHWILLLMGGFFFLMWFLFARRYGRYLIIVFPLLVIMLCGFCNFRKAKTVFCIVIAIALVQYVAAISYTLKSRQLDSTGTAEVLDYLKKQPISEKVFWEEWEMASYYIPGINATWTHEIFCNNAILQNMYANRISTVVVAKRFNYGDKNRIYDKGWPLDRLKSFEELPDVEKKIENRQYIVFKLKQAKTASEAIK